MILLLVCGRVCRAQQRGRLPDSVSTSVEEIPAVKTDTVVVSSHEQASGAVPGDDAMDSDTAEETPAELRTVPDSTVSRLQSEKDFAYANDPAYWQKEKKEADTINPLWALLLSKWFRYFIYCLLGAILLYAIYRIIAENNLRVFYRRPAKVGKTVGGDDAEEVSPEDLGERLQRAIREGQHRVAVRYLYLQTLRLLEEKEWIQYHIKSTGEDYLRQMTAHPQIREFRFLHSAYERVWYGEFPIDKGTFDRLYAYFQEFFKTARQSA